MKEENASQLLSVTLGWAVRSSSKQRPSQAEEGKLWMVLHVCYQQ